MQELKENIFPFYCFTSDEQSQLKILQKFLKTSPPYSKRIFNAAEKCFMVKDALKITGFSHINIAKRSFFGIKWESEWDDNEWNSFLCSLRIIFFKFLETKKIEYCQNIHLQLLHFPLICHSKILTEKYGSDYGDISVSDWDEFCILNLPDILNKIQTKEISENLLDPLLQSKSFQSIQKNKNKLCDWSKLDWVIYLKEIEGVIQKINPKNTLKMIEEEITNYNLIVCRKIIHNNYNQAFPALLRTTADPARPLTVLFPIVAFTSSVVPILASYSARCFV